MLPFLRPLLLLLLATSAAAAEWTIATLGGTGAPGSTGDGGPALAARINGPFGVVRGPDGAVWLCEYYSHCLRRIAPDGTIGTVAGTGHRGYTGDGGPATAATFNNPAELRFDPAGDLFVADMGNQVIRRIDAKSGIITTVAGNGRKGYAGDGGPAIRASLNSPHGLQFGPDGALYICDVSNHAIRRVELATGLITTFAGTGQPGVTPDGAELAGTPLTAPRSLDFDRAGNLWLVTREGHQLFRIDRQSHRFHLMAGTGEKGFAGNGGLAREAQLNGPKGLAVDAAGNVWLADCENHSIRVLEAATGRIELVAGTGVLGAGTEADPLRCALNRPHGVFVEADGSVLVGDSEGNRVRVLRRK